MRFSALLILLFALPLGRAESDQHGGGEEPVLDPINSRSGSEMPVYKGLRAPVGRVWRSTAFLTPATFLAMAIAMAYLIVHCFIALKAHKSRSYQQISARRLASAPEEFCSTEKTALLAAENEELLDLAAENEALLEEKEPQEIEKELKTIRRKIQKLQQKEQRLQRQQTEMKKDKKPIKIIIAVVIIVALFLTALAAPLTTKLQHSRASTTAAGPSIRAGSIRDDTSIRAGGHSIRPASIRDDTSIRAGGHSIRPASMRAASMRASIRAGGHSIRDDTSVKLCVIDRKDFSSRLKNHTFAADSLLHQSLDRILDQELREQEEKEHNILMTKLEALADGEKDMRIPVIQFVAEFKNKIINLLHPTTPKPIPFLDKMLNDTTNAADQDTFPAALKKVDRHAKVGGDYILEQALDPEKRKAKREELKKDFKENLAAMVKQRTHDDRFLMITIIKKHIDSFMMTLNELEDAERNDIISSLTHNIKGLRDLTKQEREGLVFFADPDEEKTKPRRFQDNNTRNHLMRRLLNLSLMQVDEMDKRQAGRYRFMKDLLKKYERDLDYLLGQIVTALAMQQPREVLAREMRAAFDRWEVQFVTEFTEFIRDTQRRQTLQQTLPQFDGDLDEKLKNLPKEMLPKEMDLRKQFKESLIEFRGNEEGLKLLGDQYVLGALALLDEKKFMEMAPVFESYRNEVLQATVDKLNLGFDLNPAPPTTPAGVQLDNRDRPVKPLRRREVEKFVSTTVAATVDAIQKGRFTAETGIGNDE